MNHLKERVNIAQENVYITQKNISNALKIEQLKNKVKKQVSQVIADLPIIIVIELIIKIKSLLKCTNQKR